MKNISNGKILIVEDSETMNLMIQEILNKIGFQAYGVFSGEEALDWLNLDIKPDLILIDIYLGKMNGFELYTKILEQKKYKSVPVLFLTSYYDKKNTQKALKLGAIDFISKPFDKTELLLKIRNHFKYINIQKALLQKDTELEIQNKELQNANAKIEESEAKLKEQNKELDKKVEKRTKELYEATKIAKDNEEKYNHLLKNTRTAIIKLNKNGFITFFNEYASELLEYSENEVLGKHVISTIVPGFDSDNNDLSKMVKMFTSSLGEHYNTANENENITKSGKRIWMSWSNKAVIDKNGNIIEIVSAGIDITKRRKAELEREKAKQEAENANRLKSEFLTNMSHEIRTPMNAIVGFSEILQSRLTNKKHRSFISKIAKSGKHLLDLINDILDLSKIEAGQLEIQKEASNLQSILREMPLIFSEKSEQKQIPISISFNEKIPKSVLIDSARIRQVLLNLVSNALKFTEKGSISIIVSIKQTSKLLKTVALSIEVKDTGIGIPENQIDEIFESFRQVDGQSTRKYGGTGLGLAITKRLIELMGGTISVKSTVGLGSIFKIAIKDVEVLDFEKKERNTDKAFDITFEKSKILYVEDNEDNLELVSLFLENENLEMKDAKNGKDALAVLENYMPDLILMDIQMAEMNGYETTKTIRKNEKFNAIPIIALTANATKEEVRKYSHIFEEYLTKPVSEKTLINTISNYLKHTKKEIKPIKKQNTNNYLSEIKEQKAQIKEYSIELKNILDKELKPLYNELIEVLAVDNLELFANKNKKVGQKYNVPVLVKYSEELQASITNFDLNEIKKKLTLFLQITEIICE